MNHDSLVAEFRRELPFYLRCTIITAEKSAYNVQAYLRAQPDPFPDCFASDRIVAYLSHMASTPPMRGGKDRREASTINDLLKSLRRFARWAVSRGFITADPTVGIKGLAERHRTILAPNPPDIAKVIMASRSYGNAAELQARNFAIICFLTDSGVRAAELLEMNLADVWNGKTVSGRVTIRGKGGKERLVPIRPAVQDAICEYLRRRRAVPNEIALWLDMHGRRMTYAALRNMLRGICAEAGVRVNLHDFRRFCHTELWKKGISLIDGMMLSGHAAEKDYQLYIRRAMQERALKEHGKRSPLDSVLALIERRR